MEDMGLENLLTGTEISESGNVFDGAKTTNVGDINTDHVVEKDLFGETENLENINLEVDEGFSKANERVDVDIVETEKYIEEYLDRFDTDVESSCDSQEDGILEKDDYEERLELIEVLKTLEQNKVARYIRRLGCDEDYIDSSETDSDDSKDELDPEVVAGINLPARRKSIKL
ncbi:hypothetical protein HAX54_034156, partial [Datura stramonium]|nr:hypothetical protein [Datura stramonium]